MSDPEDQSDGCYAICPYCLSKWQVEAEDFNESGVDEECGECGKTYHRVTVFTVDHDTFPTEQPTP